MQILMLGSVSPPNLRHALVLAGFAALGLVFELLIVKEELFPGGKDKICPAVHAFESLVLEFHERPTSPLFHRPRLLTEAMPVYSTLSIRPQRRSTYLASAYS